MENKLEIKANGTQLICTIFGVFTAFLGYHINKVVQGSDWPVFWAVMDFFFWFFAWIKWLIQGHVNLTIIQDAFSWFLQ